MKVLVENIGNKISDILCSNIFDNISAGAKEIKEQMNKWDYIKLKSFCVAKEAINKIKRNKLYRRTYLPMLWTRVYSPKYIKNPHNSTPGRQNIQPKNG